MSLYKNQFTGTIPSWNAIPSLFFLDLGFNALTGTLPESLVKFNRLRRVYLNNNNFNGTIPISFPEMGNKKLIQLHLNDNDLSGEVPADWWNGRSYQKFLLELRLENNNFSGELSEALCSQDVRTGYGEMVEVNADCDICSCSLCTPHCNWNPFYY